MKGGYPYEYMDDWEKFDEKSLPEKKDFNMEDITDVDYAQSKSLCKKLEINNLGKYHDLYGQSDTFC